MSEAHAQAEAPKRRSWVRLALIALAVVGLVVLFTQRGDPGEYVTQIKTWVAAAGVWGPLVFITAYMVAVVAFIPASLLTAAAGAVFGVGAGTAYTFVGATVGSTLAFAVARYLARGSVERWIEGDARFASIDRAVAAQGRRIVFLLRLTPAVPFNVLNYALGLTRVSLLDYVLASVGMVPGTLLYVYLGKVAGDAAEGGKSPAEYAFLLLGLAATVAVTVIITRIARGALREATDASS